MRSALVLVTLLCIGMVVARRASQRLHLQQQIIDQGTLIYNDEKRHAKSVQYMAFSQGTQWTSGPDPNVRLRDLKWLPFLSQWTKGSLAATRVDAVSSRGACPPWLNELLKTGELHGLELERIPSGSDLSLDLNLIRKNRGLERLRLDRVSVPPETFQGFDKLNRLKECLFSQIQCDFSTLTEKGFAPNIEELRIHTCEFAGSDLAMLGSCHKLQELYIQSCPNVDLTALHGSQLPASLRILSMRNSEFTAKCLQLTQSCPLLEKLDISGRHGTKDLRGLKSLALPESLVEIDLSNCKLDRAVWEALARLPRLESLTVDECEFADTDVEGLSFAATLDTFSCRETRASIHVASSLCSCDKLEVLNFAQTELSDECLRQMGEKPKLRMLLAGGTKLTNAAGPWLATVEGFQRLELLGLSVDDTLFQQYPKLLDIVDLRVDTLSESLKAELKRRRQQQLRKLRAKIPTGPMVALP